MATLSIRLGGRLLDWLRARSAEAGVSPEELVEETLRRQELAERFVALTGRIGEKAAQRGLTPEGLDDLLGGGDG